MNFNGTDLTTILKVNKITGRGLTEWEVGTLAVPNRDGLYYRNGSKRRKERIINVDVTIMAKSMRDLRGKIDQLNNILDVDEPKPLIFSDEPDKVYYAIPETPSNGDDGIDYINQSTIKFICPDPYKYGPEISLSFDTDVFTISNNGATEAKPVFDLEAKVPVTIAAIQNQLGEHVILGQPTTTTDTTYQKEVLVMRDTCSTTTGWTQAGYVDNGYIGGNIGVDNDAFIAETVGSAILPYAWQGPSIKRSIGKSLQDFRLEVEVELLNVGRADITGMIEIYMLDDANNTVAKIGIEDVWTNIERVQGKMQLGNLGADRYQYYPIVEKYYGWNNYKGILRLTREGNMWHPYWALVRADGKHDWVSSAFRYTDFDGKYSAKVTQVQIALRLFAGTTKANMRIKDIKVYELNVNSGDVPIIANPGDHIIIDSENDDILINGESRMDLKSFSSSFFTLKKGNNELVVTPEGAFDVTCRYKERY